MSPEYMEQARRYDGTLYDPREMVAYLFGDSPKPRPLPPGAGRAPIPPKQTPEERQRNALRASRIKSARRILAAQGKTPWLTDPPLRYAPGVSLS